MYETHFRLHSRPFRGTLPGHRPFAVPAQEAVLAQLMEGFRAGEGFLTLLGEAGTGKTFLARQLVECLAEEYLLAWITAHSWETRTGLLQAILYDLGLPHLSGSAQELRLPLTDFLLENAQEDRSILLIVDDAHHLEPDLLEELRQWGNLGGPQERLLQVLLVGQPALRHTMRLPPLASLRQQIAAWLTLEPWENPTAAAFVREHLRRAGGSDDLLNDEALQTLVAQAGGVPRVLLQTANRAFWLAAQAQAESVDLEAVWEALTELNGGTNAAEDALRLEDDADTADLESLTPLPVPHPKPHKAAS